MKCPYCDNEMKMGFIPACKMALMWIPDGGKLPKTVFNKTKIGINLTDVPSWTYKKAESYCCEECKIIITPIKESE